MPRIFKGIALFTPGGDLIYCIDPTKQDRWHSHLCMSLQEILKLPEPPHFLVPGYTATIDRWLDPLTQQIKVAAEAYPPVQRYQSLLNAVFGSDSVTWAINSWQEEFNNPILLEGYRRQFPQLWECHELIFRCELNEQNSTSLRESDLGLGESELGLSKAINPGYVLSLFVSGNNLITHKVFETLHTLLEEKFPYPYSLKIIDVAKHPEEAEKHQVTAIPTLMRIWPEPVQKIVGEFKESDRLLQILTR